MDFENFLKGTVGGVLALVFQNADAQAPKVSDPDRALKACALQVIEKVAPKGVSAEHSVHSGLGEIYGYRTFSPKSLDGELVAIAIKKGKSGPETLVTFSSILENGADKVKGRGALFGLYADKGDLEKPAKILSPPFEINDAVSKKAKQISGSLLTEMRKCMRIDYIG